MNYILQVEDDLIASEIHESVSKNCVEFPNDGKENNTYGDEIIDWNECPIHEMGLLNNMKI